MPDGPGNPASQAHREVVDNFPELLEEARKQREFRTHLEEAIRAAMPSTPAPQRPPLEPPSPRPAPPNPVPPQTAVAAPPAPPPPAPPPPPSSGSPPPSPDDELRKNLDLDAAFGNAPTPPPPQPASSANSGRGVSMTESEFQRYREKYGAELAERKLQQGDISIRAPVSIEQLRRQQLEKRYGPEQAASIIQEREEKQRQKDADKQQREQARQTTRTQREQEKIQRQQAQHHARREHIRKQTDIRSGREQLKQAEEEELRRREKMNKSLGMGANAVESFTRGLAHGSPSSGVAGGLSSLGGIGGILAAVATTLAGFVTRDMMRRESDIRHGGQELSPSGARTEQISEQIRQMAQARQAGELGRQQANASMQQLQAQAIRMGMRPTDNPMDPFHNAFGAAQGARERASQTFFRELVRTGSLSRAREAGTEPVAEYFRRWIREHGGTPGPFKQDIVIPGVQPGILGGPGAGAGGLQYQSELQIGTLQREDATNEKLREILEEMQRLGRLMEGLPGRMASGLEDVNLNWG